MSEPRAASRLSITSCSKHGNVFIELLGPEGASFAIASLPARTANAVAAELTLHAKAILEAAEPQESRH